jgi:phenylacetate-CoA ligase
MLPSSLIDRFCSKVSVQTLAGLYKTTPPWLSNDLALDRFRRTVRWAGEHSPFYRKAFAEQGINPRAVRTPADLKDFYTTPDDLVANPRSFLCGSPSIVFESSGTSGRNKQVYFSKDELESMGHNMAAGLRMMGLLPGDRVANAFDFSIWIPGMLTHYALMGAGNFCLAFGKVDPLEVYRRLEQHQFNVVMGEPTWLIRLTELAERDGGGNLKLMIGGAEEMPAEAVAWIKKVWNGCTVKMCYGSVEQGVSMAFQPCNHHEGYHLDTVDFLPEIIETDANGYGELVFTTLQRRVMPLIRYRTRDVTRWLSNCPCGIRQPRIEKLRGRRDELVIASGGNLYPLMFENILREVPGLGLDFQVIFSLEGVREIVEINVETSRSDEASLFEQVKQSAAHLYPDFMKNLALGIFQLRLRTHAPGGIRTGRKLKRLVDRRHAPDPVDLELSPNGVVQNGVADEQLV